MTAASRPDEILHFTGDPESDRLIATDPLALLIGFALDQQVTVQKAFSGPAEIRRRLGHLDAERIAGTEPALLERVFVERPAIHRFPAAMAGRVQALCAFIASEYDGDASRIWREAADGEELRRRLLALPSIGEMKARSLIAILGKRLGVRLPGLESVMPSHPTLGDVDSPEALERYQAHKRARKAEMRAQAAAPK
jgi:uncharacterized HhH-GPD family protein